MNSKSIDYRLADFLPEDLRDFFATALGGFFNLHYNMTSSTHFLLI
jgi:hypothetical protein